MRQTGWKQKTKFAVFALVPVTLLTGGAEVGLRFWELDQPQLKAPMLICESAGLHRADPDLFWTLRPRLNKRFQGVKISTNSLCLRSPEVGEKGPNEFRVLCLGESTTFGAGVPNSGTYAARLEEYLARWDPARVYRVINGGVSAYSSFQSLKYLELRGVQLKPDLVLFYHEYNDSLQTIGRDGGPKDEVALAATDMELYKSRRNALHRAMVSRSAIYRYITYHTARHRLEGPSPTHHKVTNQQGNPVPTRLPVRVTAEERRQVLEQLQAVCDKNQIQLVIMHPAYRDSSRHECDLTQYCQEHSIPLFEAYDSLHPTDLDATDLFLDGIHPNVLGHGRMARDLFLFLCDAGYVTAQR